MLLVEVVPEAIPSVGRTQATWEGVLELGGALQKSDIEHVIQLLYLTDRNLVPVHCRIRPVHLPPIRHHRPQYDLHPTVLEWYPTY